MSAVNHLWGGKAKKTEALGQLIDIATNFLHGAHLSLSVGFPKASERKKSEDGQATRWKRRDIDSSTIEIPSTSNSRCSSRASIETIYKELVSEGLLDDLKF